MYDIPPNSKLQLKGSCLRMGLIGQIKRKMCKISVNVDTSNQLVMLS